MSLSTKRIIDINRLNKATPYILIFGLFNKRDNNATKIRYYHVRLVWREMFAGNKKRFLKFLILFIIWPFFYIKNNKKLSAKAYKKVTLITGKSKFRQKVEQLYLAFFYSISPSEYFMYELYQPENFKNAKFYLMRLNFKMLVFYFLDNSTVKKNNLKDVEEIMKYTDLKVLSYQVFQKHNIATVPILARITEDNTDWLYDKGQIEEWGDLFFKPEKGRGGRGAQLWIARDGKYYNKSGDSKDLDNLVDFIRKVGKEEGYFEYIMQPRMKNNEELFFGTKALNTVRVCTTLIDGKIDWPYGVFRFSIDKKSDVDNFHAGGVVAPIDMKTGRLGSGSNMDITNPGYRVDVHPVSQKPIKGKTLPLWEEVKELVARGHREAFGNRILLGWDIAITPEGPLVIEVNGWPDNELIQKGYNIPMGKMESFAPFADYFEREYKYWYSRK